MINFRFKKVRFGELPKSDPTFYKRFHVAWGNFQENELEARLQTLTAASKSRKPRLREAL